MAVVEKGINNLINLYLDDYNDSKELYPNILDFINTAKNFK